MAQDFREITESDNSDLVDLHPAAQVVGVIARSLKSCVVSLVVLAIVIVIVLWVIASLNPWFIEQLFSLLK